MKPIMPLRAKSCATVIAAALVLPCALLVAEGQNSTGAQLVREVRALRQAIEGDPIERAIRSNREFGAIIMEERRSFRESVEQRAEEMERKARMDAFLLLSIEKQEERVRLGLATPEQIEIVLQRRRAIQELESSLPPAQPAPQATYPAHYPGSGGTMVKGGVTYTVPPAAVREPPPPGMAWVFPARSMQPLLKVEPVAMTEEQFRAAELESYKRMLAKYPFLKDRADSRRQQVEQYMLATEYRSDYETLYNLPNWREYVADECALLYNWPRT